MLSGSAFFWGSLVAACCSNGSSEFPPPKNVCYMLHTEQLCLCNCHLQADDLSLTQSILVTVHTTSFDITKLFLCLSLCIRHSPDKNTPCISMYYMFRPIGAIIRYIELLRSPFCLLYLPTLASVYTLGLRCTGVLFM